MRIHRPQLRRRVSQHFARAPMSAGTQTFRYIGLVWGHVETLVICRYIARAPMSACRFSLCLYLSLPPSLPPASDSVFSHCPIFIPLLSLNTPCTLHSTPSPLPFCSSQAHRSQAVWYRWLFIFLSRYTFYNRLVPMGAPGRV